MVGFLLRHVMSSSYNPRVEEVRMFIARWSIGLVLGLSVIVAGVQAQRGAPKPQKIVPNAFGGDRAGTLAISGVASSARHCVGPGANVHALGSVPASSQVEITFTSDFDPVATVTVVQLGDDAPDDLARTSFVADDDGGGNLEPEIRFTTTFSGTLALHVGKFTPDQQAGCYFYKVEIRTP
jgi:hypothetical protein